MPLEVGKKYRAEVTAAVATEKQDGTFGIALSYHTDEGDIDGTLWIEQKYLAYRKKDLMTLGATEENLADWEWLQEPTSLVGAVCQIVIDSYFGKDGAEHLIVKYINRLRKEASADAAQKAAGLFGQKAATVDVDPFGEVPFPPDGVGF